MQAKQQKSIYNFANFLSISRIFSVIPLIFCFNKMEGFPEYKFYSILVVIYIFLSDVLDGFFARISNHVTNFGKVIDPVADKVCFMVVLVFLIDKFDKPDLLFNPFLAFYVLLCIRDTILVAVSTYSIYSIGYVSQSNITGKIFIGISTLMVIFYIYDINYTLAIVFYFLAIFFMIISTYFYIDNQIKKMNNEFI